jgi:serine/threonine protein kinase
MDSPAKVTANRPPPLKCSIDTEEPAQKELIEKAHRLVDICRSVTSNNLIELEERFNEGTRKYESIMLKITPVTGASQDDEFYSPYEWAMTVTGVVIQGLRLHLGNSYNDVIHRFREETEEIFCHLNLEGLKSWDTGNLDIAPSQENVMVEIDGVLARIPPRLSSPGKAGTHKVIVGISQDWLLFDLIDPWEYVTLSDEVRLIIKQENFSSFVLQTMISGTQLMSRNLGPENLSEQIKSGAYVHDAKYFIKLAQDIKGLHSKGFFHGDLKPSNMILKDGQIYVFDNDSIREINKSYSAPYGTRGYLPGEFWLPLLPSGVNQLTDPRKQDNYAFFASMIEAWAKCDPVESHGENEETVHRIAVATKTYRPFNESIVAKFCQSLPSSSDQPDEVSNRRNEVAHFLNDPVSNDLSEDLPLYLGAPGI